ncbi:MAG: hypothetical protein JWN48_6095 [Myxococcaceae bacterium]|nr:hypothetical protein [Myxococcaceae bacterium]
MRSIPPSKKADLTGRLSRPPVTAAGTPAIAAGPAVTVKGFYLRALLKELADNGQHLTDVPSFREFGDYPLSVARELLYECAQRLYPHERRAEGLRRLGWIIYPTLLSTMVGRVVFASLGDDLRTVLRIASRGFEISITAGKYEAVRIGARDADVTVREFPLHPESFLLGVFEGVLAHYGLADGVVRVRPLSATDVDFHLSW